MIDHVPHLLTLDAHAMWWVNMLIYLRFASVIVIIVALSWLMFAVPVVRHRTTGIVFCLFLLLINLGSMVVNVLIFGVVPQ